MERAVSVYEDLVGALVSLGRFDQALETVERTKSQTLAALLVRTQALPDAPQEVQERLEG